MTTTKEFEDFKIMDNPLLAYHKLHIQKESRGIFIVVIWEAPDNEIDGPLISSKSAGPPQMPPLVADIQKPRLAEDYPRSGQSSSSSVRGAAPPGNPLTQSIYPSLDALMSGSLERSKRQPSAKARITIPCTEYSPCAPPLDPVSSTRHGKERKAGAGVVAVGLAQPKSSGKKEEKRNGDLEGPTLPNPIPAQMTQVPLTSLHLTPVLEPTSSSSIYTPPPQSLFDPNIPPMLLPSANSAPQPVPPSHTPFTPFPVSSTMKATPQQVAYSNALPDVLEAPYASSYPPTSSYQNPIISEKAPLSTPFGTPQSINGIQITRYESYPFYPVPSLDPSQGFQQRSLNTLKPKTPSFASSSRDDFVEMINSLQVPNHPVVESSPSESSSEPKENKEGPGRAILEAQ